MHTTNLLLQNAPAQTSTLTVLKPHFRMFSTGDIVAIIVIIISATTTLLNRVIEFSQYTEAVSSILSIIALIIGIVFLLYRIQHKKATTEKIELEIRELDLEQRELIKQEIILELERERNEDKKRKSP